jgi:lipoprotein-releasing system permease protein
LNTERFIAGRIISGSGRNNQLSRPITKISVLSIALGIAVMLIAVSIVTGFQQEIRNKLIGFGSHMQISNYDSNLSDEPQPISSDQPFMEDLKNDPDIRHIQVFATKNGIVKTKTDNEGVVLKGIGADYDWSFIRENLKEGDVFEVSDTGLSRGIVISKYLSEKLGLKLKDKMVIYFLTKKTDSINVRYEQRVKSFYVTGIYETGFEDIDQKLVLVDLRQIQKLNYWEKDQVAGFEINIHNYEKVNSVADRVDEMIGQAGVVQTVREMNPNVFSWLDLMDINSVILIVLVLLVATINMISALLIHILERTNMIGILKALGSTNKNIQKIFLYNAAYLVGKGMLWGNVLGLGLMILQKLTGIFKLDQAQYYVSVIPIRIDIASILLVNAGTLLCCILMMLLPTLILSRITPVKTIRFS